MKLYGITSKSKFKEYVEIEFQVEHREVLLEDWLENNSDDIIENGQLLIIGRQVTTNLGGFIDLLAIDRRGDVVVIEIKRNRTPRKTIAQALEYASFVEKIGYEQLEDILRTYIGDNSVNLAQYHKEYFDLSSDEASVFNHDQKIVIVGQAITSEIRQTSAFLRTKGIRVTCLEFTF
ncbi:MAG: endonuclease NucS, partial [Chloroflexota bacterium]|nr:endonuclease NucS [Chloroflexota bacterium]